MANHLIRHSAALNKFRYDDSEEASGAQSDPGGGMGSVVETFLTRHIPDQVHIPDSSSLTSPITTPAESMVEDGTNSSKQRQQYCYRHRPDPLCQKRPAHETTMADIQSHMNGFPLEDQQAITQVWSLFSASPPAQRKLILQGILTQCCFPQLSFISAQLRDLIRIDYIAALPPEVSYKILSYLDAISLCRASQVSRKWRTMADDDIVWQRICAQHIDRKCPKCGWGLPLLERRRLKAERKAQGEVLLDDDDSSDEETAPAVVNTEATPPVQALDELLVSLKRRPDEAADTSIVAEDTAVVAAAIKKKPRRPSSALSRKPWKDVYSERCKIEQNWRRGRYTVRKLKGHSDGVMCLQVDDANNMLATGSYDTTVKIWNLETGEVVRTLSGHTRGVGALQFDDCKLISASMDGTLRIWNYRSGDCLSILHGHSDGVICLHYDGSLLASGSADATIRVWNFDTKECFTMRGHRDWVNSVRISSTARTVFSASDDTTIRLWNLDTRECVRTFVGHVGQVQCVIPLAPSLLSECDDDGQTEIKMRDSRCISYTEGSSHVVSSALDNTVKIWRTEDGKCIKTLFGHVEGVWALAADTLRLVSGGHDR